MPFRYAIFTDEDGNPLAIDATDAIAVGVEESEEREGMVTRIYCQSGDFWAVTNDFEEVVAKLERHVQAINEESSESGGA